MTLAVAELARLSTLLDMAMDLDGPAQQAWLDGLPAPDRALAPTLRRLLAAHAGGGVETGDWLDRGPVIELLAQDAGADHASDDQRPHAGRAGETVGPYHLLQPLGQGGMGSVWLAERSDGSVKRQVALKLPHLGWAPGLAERFARERDILAGLEHAHIARLYDAGLDTQGRPFMALEYVEGQAIDVYCRERALPVADRLRLLLQVADALAFAHSRLVIHRDIKPANILVTPQGQVRLLDFGIAKLMQGDGAGAAAETALTRASGRALTLDYASPEQIRGEAIGTASDVYSLAVVAFELLTGSKPYRLKRGSAAELEEAIAAQDVPLASTRATTPQARQALLGDIDAIVNRALKKPVDQRYASVDAFALDIRRHLEGQRVLARPDTLAYRARRLLQRHRLPLAAGAVTVAAFALAIGAGATALVMGALLLGLGAALWQAASARRHAAAAQREALHARAVQGFVADIFRSNSDRQADPALARATTARELLDLGASRLNQTLQDAPEARAEVLAMLGEMYYQLEMDEQAADLDGQLVALRRQLDGPRHRRVAEALVHLAGSLHATARRDQILPALQEAESILDELAEGQTPLRAELLSRLSQRYYNLSQARSRDYAERAVVAWRAQAAPDLDHLSAALDLSARVHKSCGEFGQAARLYRQAQAEMAKMAAASQMTVLESRLSLAEILCFQMKTDEALDLARLGVEQARAALGESAPATSVACSRWGGMLHARGQRVLGLDLLESAVRTALQTRGEHDTMHVPLTRANLARAWFAEGRVTEALGLMQQVNEGTYRRHYDGSVVLAMGLRSEAAMRAALGQWDAAQALLDEALDLTQRGSDGCWQAWRFNRMHLDHASIALSRGDAAQALVHLQRVAAPREIDIPAPQPELIEHAALAALAHQALGDSALAVATADAVWPDIARLATVARHPNVEADAALAVGKVWMRAGRLQQAHHALQHALALRIEFDHASSPWIAEAQVGLAQWHELSAQPDAAAALRARARQLLATFSAQDSPFHAQLAAGQSGVLPGWSEASP